MAERFARATPEGAWPRSKARPLTVSPSCCSSAPTTPAARQMALGWFNHLAGDRAVAWSGGSEPGLEVNPAAVEAMAEVGIDITERVPQAVDRRDRPGRRRRDHHGLRRRLPLLPRQTVRGLGARRPGRSRRRRSPPHPRRDQGARRRPDRLLGSPLEERALRCRGSLGRRCTASVADLAFSGGRDRRRSGDLPLFRRTLCRLSYPTVRSPAARCGRVAVPTGLEPAASGLTGRRALQLHHGTSGLRLWHPQRDSNPCRHLERVVS